MRSRVTRGMLRTGTVLLTIVPGTISGQAQENTPAINRIELPAPIFPATLKQTPATTFDVVVVQASSGGVAAAIEAARRGLKVALIEPTTRIGGMPVNGLSATDLRRDYHASGFFVRFRDRIAALYKAEGVKSEGLEYEPRVAHEAMKSLVLEQSNITVFQRARLARVHSGQMLMGRRQVESIDVDELNAVGQPTGKRTRFFARVFIDATDCGDLAAWAGAPYHIGREARSPQEPHNGVIYYDRANDKRLPGSTGKADRRMQSYAYLLTVKDYGPNADKTISMPEGYRKEDFIHSPDWKHNWAVMSGKMPHDKMELNQHPEGNDLQEINYHYAEGSYAERTRVEALYRKRILGYLYFLQTEQGQKQIGLPDDEYPDTGGFPPLLYVREGRRIDGEQLPTENEIAQAARLTRPESIGLGDYPMDSHAVRRKTDWNSPDMGEGEWWLYQYTPAHSLPFGVIVPLTLDNVFVTTAVSSTHVSYGTYRLEPVRMAFGQAAGIAASLAIRYHLRGRDVPARQVQDELLPSISNPNSDPNVKLTYLSDIKPDTHFNREMQYLAVRGFTFAAEELKPDAPTTQGELAHWLTQMANRAAPERQGREDRVSYYPYMGSGVSREAAAALEQQSGAEANVNRAVFARALVRVMNWTGEGSSRYADTTDTDADALWAHGIDARLWDGMTAFAPEGKYFFRPDAPLTHAQCLAALYIAQLWLGPKFNDNPADGRNGRSVPPVPYDTPLP